MNEELRLSVSKTKTFLGCKKQFHFGYILKLPKKDRDYHIFGKFCHMVLEEFHLAYIRDGSTKPFNVEMGIAFKKAQVEYKDKMTKAMNKECWGIINNYLKKISKKEDDVLSGNVVAVEKHFKFDIGNNVILNGMIDRIQIDDDNVIHVADYKTTKNKKYIKNDWFQLLTYAFVIWSEDPTVTKVRASYILLRHDFELVTKEFNLEDIMNVRDQILDYAAQIRNEKEYAANPTALCNYCDFLHECPEGKAKAFDKITYGEVSY